MFSKNKISGKLVEEFLSAIPDKFKHIEFCLHEENPINAERNNIKEKKYQLLNLDKKYELIHKDFSDNSKRNIKKAIKAGLKIRPDISPEKIVNLLTRWG